MTEVDSHSSTTDERVNESSRGGVYIGYNDRKHRCRVDGRHPTNGQKTTCN